MAWRRSLEQVARDEAGRLAKAQAAWGRLAKGQSKDTNVSTDGTGEHEVGPESDALDTVKHPEVCGG